MKIVILDGYTENPGDLSWNGFEALGEVTVYDRTPFADGSGEIVRRAKGADTGASAGRRRNWPRPSAWRCLLSISSRRTTAWRAW